MTKQYLQVKIMSLAEEAKIIKLKEKAAKRNAQKQAKWLKENQSADADRDPYALYEGLREHRIQIVRKEARASSLAYGFMRGRPYRALEYTYHEAPDWDKVKTIARNFSGLKYAGDNALIDFNQRFEEWKTAVATEEIVKINAAARYNVLTMIKPPYTGPKGQKG